MSARTRAKQRAVAAGLSEAAAQRVVDMLYGPEAPPGPPTKPETPKSKKSKK